ncbi:ATP-binding protein [Marinigracilibium pacificum]|uniref:ATP-binding protein n=1 Tax=Marinigracilibium pacificum TaxID=2729599 RepID=A0A848IVF6_9BACT|nr:ATP-binding protein [Marinigracilibium pacificum]NMM47265.1 ATP-binding protein [Marinigracilibium pacificum]
MDINQIFEVYKTIGNVFSSFYSPQEKTVNLDVFWNFNGIPEESIKNIITDSNSKFTTQFGLNNYEQFIIALTILPYYYPDAYKGIRILQNNDEYVFSVLGGVNKGDNKICYPTGETILYLLGGRDPLGREYVHSFLSPDSPLFRYGLIQLLPGENGTPRLAGQFYPSDELIAIIKGETYVPEYSSSFPAKRITTQMQWDDLVLPHETFEALEELRMWMKHGTKLLQHSDLKKRIKPGYRTLFYGPPGTGKTLTASLIGNEFNIPVYRVDLSLIVSKWVGETEKNLKQLFDMAENKHWALFFDEADSLFGKRTQTSSANDRYANQEVSYLLQRIEDFPGLVILASNLKNNMDPAFSRRFQSTILFPMPDSEMRFQLWKKAFPEDFIMEEAINFRDIARKYELAGGAITNVIRYCTLKAYSRGKNEIWLEDLEQAIIREYQKNGKIAT